MDCRDASKFTALDIDGEIDAEDAKGLAAHLESCRFCKQRWEQEKRLHTAVKERLQSSVQDTAKAPPDLRKRIMAAGRAETRTNRLSAFIGVPAFASFALVVVSVLVPNHSEDKADTVNAGQKLTERAILRHSSNLPAEFSANNYDAPNLERVLSQHLPFRVRIPNDDSQSRFVGARLSHIGRNDVAYLMYDHRGSRLSVFAFPRGSGINAVDGHRLIPQSDRRGRPVYVGRQRGHNVVSWSDKHADFAVVSDLDVRDMVQWSLRVRDLDRVGPQPTPVPRVFPRSGTQVQTVSHRR